MIALYPGAFKPPHRGHFEVVKGLLNGSHGGQVYDIDSYAEAGISALKGEKNNVKKINKVIVFVGEGQRNGITKEESIKVWKIYSKYLPGLLIADGGKNPMITAKDYAKANSNDSFYAITGIRSEEDLIDLKRVTTFKNRKNVTGLVIPSGKDSSVRATDFRNAILNGSLDNVLDFFPKELSKDEILKIMNMLKSSVVAEVMNRDLESKLNEMFKIDPAEGSSGTAIAPRSASKSEDRFKLINVYKDLLHSLKDKSLHIGFNQDHIIIKNQDNTKKVGYDYTPYMSSILEYMIDEGIKITPLPEIKIKKDLEESSNFFGRTAYYNPTEKEVVLYVTGRHPKDIMRSFTHEMIHHKQNLEGRLGNISTTNTNEDEYLLELEKEAYLEGNITFRNWEDSQKN